MMALRLRSLEDQNEEMKKVINENLGAVQQAFVHVDMHTQVVQRVVHDVTSAIASGYLGRIYVTDLAEGEEPGDQVLNLHKYYEDYKKLYKSAPEKTRDVALIAWAHGKSLDSALGAALREDEKVEPAGDEPESDFETEHFGGDYGKSTNEQVAPTGA